MLTGSYRLFNGSDANRWRAIHNTESHLFRVPSSTSADDGNRQEVETPRLVSLQPDASPQDLRASNNGL